MCKLSYPRILLRACIAHLSEKLIDPSSRLLQLLFLCIISLLLICQVTFGGGISSLQIPYGCDTLPEQILLMSTFAALSGRRHRPHHHQNKHCHQNPH